MLINGITWLGLHSQLDFDATVTYRQLDLPEKDRVTDRVPYSNITYDFTALYGTPGYAERTLQYKFMLSDEKGIRYLKPRVERFKLWLYESIEKSALYDDTEPEYHFNAVCTSISESYRNGVIAELTVTFAADPFKIPNASEELMEIPVSDSRYPDINDDGRVNASDVSLILSAATNLGAGHDSGLSPEHEWLADADRNGVINASDASLILKYSAQCGVGLYNDSPEGWTEYLNYELGKLKETL